MLNQHFAAINVKHNFVFFDGAQHITYALKNDPGRFLTIKLFDGEYTDEVWTFKIWRGDYNAVANYWRTQPASVLTKEDRERLENILDGALSTLASLADVRHNHTLSYFASFHGDEDA